MAVTSVQLTPTAIRDLIEIARYLNEQRDGWGLKFVDEFVKVTTPLLTFPEMYPAVRDDIRRGQVRKFKTIFIYKIQQDTVVIARIIHTSRNTDYH